MKEIFPKYFVYRVAILKMVDVDGVDGLHLNSHHQSDRQTLSSECSICAF